MRSIRRVAGFERRAPERASSLTRPAAAPISARDLSRGAKKDAIAVIFSRFCRRHRLICRAAFRREFAPERGCAGNVQSARPRRAPLGRCGQWDRRSRCGVGKVGNVRLLFEKIFGSANDRRLKGYRPKISADQRPRAEFAALSDEQLRGKTEEFRAELAAGKTPRRSRRSGLRCRTRGGQAHAQAAPFRRAVDRRHGAA